MEEGCKINVTDLFLVMEIAQSEVSVGAPGLSLDYLGSLNCIYVHVSSKFGSLVLEKQRRSRQFELYVNTLNYNVEYVREASIYCPCRTC